jgi:hypothetical protein
VDPDLVRAARLELDGDEARTRERLENAVSRDRVLAALPRSGDRAPPQVAVARQRRVEDARRRRQALHDGNVLPFDLVTLEALLKKPQSLPRAREHQRPGRFAVEPVHHPHVGPAAVAVLQVERDARSSVSFSRSAVGTASSPAGFSTTIKSASSWSTGSRVRTL